MKNAVLSAVTGLLASSSANAAIWTFDVSGTLDFTAFEARTVCSDWVPSCVETNNIRKDVWASYRISVPSFATISQIAYTPLDNFGGVTFDRNRSRMETILRIGDGTVIVDRASFYGDYNPRGCFPGDIGCYASGGSAQGLNVAVAFVSSSEGAGPVPEPTTWAMMLGGFGLIGGTLRARRQTAFIASA